MTRHLVGLLGSIRRRDLSVISESLSLRRGSDSSVGSRSDSDDSGVDSARNTVVQLVVQLWQSVLLVHRSFRQVSNGSGLNHVSDGHSLDGLVLRNTSSAVQASDWLDVTSTLLVSTVGSSLLWHFLTVSKGCLKDSLAYDSREQGDFWQFNEMDESLVYWMAGRLFFCCFGITRSFLWSMFTVSSFS